MTRFIALLTALVVPTAVAFAQRQLPANDWQREIQERKIQEAIKHRTVQVGPAPFILLTPDTKTLTVEFVNSGDSTLEADVALEFAMPRTNAQGKIVDSVTASTHPKALTGWISGVPKRVTLAPYQTLPVTLTVTVPPKTADGEYWGRIVATRKGVNLPPSLTADIKTNTQTTNLNLRSVSQLLYRQGAASTGLTITDFAATTTGRTVEACVRLRPTGSAHYRGVARVAALNETLSDERLVFKAPVAVYDELRPCFRADDLLPGKYTLTVKVDGDQADVPADMRLSAAPAEASVTFEIASPKPATVLIQQAVTTAKAADKAVFVYFGASWCGWCKKLDAFLRKTDEGKIVQKYYELVYLTTQEYEGQKSLENLGADSVMKAGVGKIALPGFFVLDAAGKQPMKGHDGYPARPPQIKAFGELLVQTAPRMTAEEREKILAALASSAK